MKKLESAPIVHVNRDFILKKVTKVIGGPTSSSQSVLILIMISVIWILTELKNSKKISNKYI